MILMQDFHLNINKNNSFIALLYCFSRLSCEMSTHATHAEVQYTCRISVIYAATQKQRSSYKNVNVICMWRSGDLKF